MLNIFRNKYFTMDDIFGETMDNLFNSFNKSYVTSPLREINLELPGIGKENISIKESHNDTIKISWKEKRGENVSEYSRNFNVIPHKDTSAEYIDGILKIKLTPKEETKIKTIEIE